MVGADAGDTTAETLSSAGTHDVTKMELLDRPTITVYISLLHPEPRGRIELRSAKASDRPVLRHELFADERISRTWLAGAVRSGPS